MSFCTSIHCMDGRIQGPLAEYLKQGYGVDYVDTITESGPCRILAEKRDEALVRSILARTAISVDKHGSRLIAVSGHYDCAGNPCDEATQKDQVRQSIRLLAGIYPDAQLIGLWVDSNWRVHEVNPLDSGSAPRGLDG